MTPSQRDTHEAIVDALAMRLGVAPARPHPKAQEYVDQPLSGLAMLHGAVAQAQRGDTRPHPDMAVLGYGIGTSDFKNALGTGASRLAALRYEASADHLQICANLEVVDFKMIEFPGADVGLDLSLKTGEGGEARAAQVVQVAGQIAKLESYDRIIGVSRNTIINDDVGLLANVFAAIGTAAATNEAKMVSDLMEANQTLADGQAMFIAANIVAQTLSATSLDVAMKALRLQTTAAGNLANLKAAVLVVAAGLELSAKTLLKSAGMDDVKVICLPWLADGRWYLFADPKVAPVIGRLILRGTKDPIYVSPLGTKIRFEFDGVLTRANAYLGVVALNRVGVVRGGV